MSVFTPGIPTYTILTLKCQYCIFGVPKNSNHVNMWINLWSSLEVQPSWYVNFFQTTSQVIWRKMACLVCMYVKGRLRQNLCKNSKCISVSPPNSHQKYKVQTFVHMCNDKRDLVQKGDIPQIKEQRTEKRRQKWLLPKSSEFLNWCIVYWMVNLWGSRLSFSLVFVCYPFAQTFFHSQLPLLWSDWIHNYPSQSTMKFGRILRGGIQNEILGVAVDHFR